MTTGGTDDFDHADRTIDAACASDDPGTASVTACHPTEHHLRIVVKDERFRVVKDLPYKLTAGEEVFSGTIDGVIDHIIKKTSGTASLEVTFGEGDVETWNLTIEPLDPVSLETGAKERLRSLLPFESALDEQGAAAISTLRDAFGLEDGEVIDADTRDLIARVYSADDTPDEEPEEWIVPEGVQTQAADLAAAFDRADLEELAPAEEVE